MRDRDSRSSLLVRNLPTDIRTDEVRDIFERYGPIRDVYLPKDYYTGRMRGFGFVEYLDVRDAEDAERHMDGKAIGGRQISVVFSKQDRKTPREMAETTGSYRSPGRGRRGRSMSPPPRRRSPSPRRHRRSLTRSVSRSRTPHNRNQERSRSPANRDASIPPEDGARRSASRSPAEI